jgi:hypothetical protein
MSETAIAEVKQVDFKKRFTDLKLGNTDEIPDKIINSHSPLKDCKARKGWWTSFLSDLESCLALRKIRNPEVIDMAEDFWEKYNCEEFRQQKKVTPENIEEANLLIDSIIPELD